MRKNLEMNVRRLVMVMLVAVMAFAFTACGAKEESTTEATDETTEAVADVDNSDKVAASPDEASDEAESVEEELTFYFEVGYEDGSRTADEITTTETTVGAALLAEGRIEGEEGEYGLYITSVDGVTLDWDTDAAYWAFYVDGEMAATGVDLTDIVDGATYSLEYAQ